MRRFLRISVTSGSSSSRFARRRMKGFIPPRRRLTSSSKEPCCSSAIAVLPRALRERTDLVAELPAKRPRQLAEARLDQLLEDGQVGLTRRAQPHHVAGT